MDFGDFSQGANLPVTEYVEHILQRFFDPVGRFIKNQRALERSARRRQ
jgi:hypothetical protein